jgi:hypothetical protein
VGVVAVDRDLEDEPEDDRERAQNPKKRRERAPVDD